MQFEFFDLKLHPNESMKFNFHVMRSNAFQFWYIGIWISDHKWICVFEINNFRNVELPEIDGNQYVITNQWVLRVQCKRKLFYAKNIQIHKSWMLATRWFQFDYTRSGALVV